MVEVEITDRMIEWAEDRMSPEDHMEYRKLNKYGSEPWRIFVGLVGQSVVMRHYKIPPGDVRETKHYDLIINGLKHEVKTISGKYKPKPWYLAVVNSSNDNSHRVQNCDRYIFVRILNNLTKGWIVGWVERQEFWNKAERHPIGSMVAGFRLDKAPAASVEIRALKKVEDETTTQ